jgi:drug/metabolite transporter (DMT)-like permease
VRLLSGAVTLWLLARGAKASKGGGSWFSAAALFAYAIAFSLAYLVLGAGVGALILFGAVQLTMLAAGLRAGERPRLVEWLGLAFALSGLVVLTLPGAAAPDLTGAALMALAGLAWGVYSLRGRGAVYPLAITADNFLRSVPLAAAAALAALPWAHVSPRGILLAAASGALASGVGYSLWYAALRGLSATRAAIVQLAVPALAAAGGVALLGETLTPRLAVAGLGIFGGVALAVLGRRR